MRASPQCGPKLQKEKAAQNLMADQKFEIEQVRIQGYVRQNIKDYVRIKDRPLFS